jgi:hypothetical protein
VRGAISESGGNASLAGKREHGEPYTGTMLETADTAKGRHLHSCFVAETTGGQGVHREVESERHEEKYRAVIEGGDPEDEPVGQRWGKVEPALWGRRRYSSTHRTKVFADGTVRKICA